MRLVYTPGRVQPKYFNNNTNFAPGFVTPTIIGEPLAQGPELRAGWDQGLPATASAPSRWARRFGNSTAFAHCQVEKVFKTVCFRAPSNQADRDVVDQRDELLQGELLAQGSLPAGRDLRRVPGPVRERTKMTP
jgi:hypothetical protein